jgi:tetrahydromethanopterin S-methyltransferase subunit G
MSDLSQTTNLEKQSLEAHVDLCAMRYLNLDTRLTNLENKVDSIHTDIVQGQKSMTKVIIGTAGTVVAGVLSIIVTMLMRGG